MVTLRMQEIAATILGRIIQLLLKDLQFIQIDCSMCQTCLAFLCVLILVRLLRRTACLHSANEILICWLIKQGAIKKSGKQLRWDVNYEMQCC